MNRLTKIYTRQGDKGTTSLATGERVAKDHPRIQAIGEVDMLNSQVGLLIAYLVEKQATVSSLGKIAELLTPCLHRLFDVGGELAMPAYQAVTGEHVQYLEGLIDSWNEQLEPLKDFILPTGTVAASQAHVCRSQARTAERNLQALHKQEPIREELLAYINRVSDLFFVAARIINFYQQTPETLWEAAKKP